MRCLPLALGMLVLITSSACSQRPVEKSDEETAAPGTSRQKQRIALADRAITRLDVARATELLEGTAGPKAARAKARLAIYRADCEGALGHLASEAAQREKGAGELLSLAEGCHGATAGAQVIEDRERGIWIRFQDQADRVLAPFLFDVIAQARAEIGRDLGVELPRPLRLDLVRDLFSLSAVSGLPVEAAETTGTVAVARWGRVTMVSPRATQHGYPWADTMAHELTHLMLSRATMDRAPLWLQEGIAKREEERWRESRAFDREPDPFVMAARAQASGRAVGITQLGNSIAMLPSADAAAIAFAEVSSFMDFWIERNGPHALKLLLRDVAHSKDADSAMRSVSGLSIVDWELLYRKKLESLIERPAQSIEPPEERSMGPREMSRTLRISELLYNNDSFDHAAEHAAPALDRAPHAAALRFAVGRAARQANWPHLEEIVGDLDDVKGPHGGWLSLRSRIAEKRQSSSRAEELRAYALSLDPFLLEVACGGTRGGRSDPVWVELSSEQRQLCEHVRELPRRGSR